MNKCQIVSVRHRFHPSLPRFSFMEQYSKISKRGFSSWRVCTIIQMVDVQYGWIKPRNPSSNSRYQKSVNKNRWAGTPDQL